MCLTGRQQFIENKGKFRVYFCCTSDSFEVCKMLCCLTSKCNGVQVVQTVICWPHTSAHSSTWKQFVITYYLISTLMEFLSDIEKNKFSSKKYNQILIHLYKNKICSQIIIFK